MAGWGNTTYKIFVGNLSDWATGQDIWELFEHYGTVVEADVVKEKKRTYGFVHMQWEEEAQAAIEALNGHTLLGVPMVVRKSGSQKTKIFVGNLHKVTRLEELKNLFEVYGPVVESDILTNFAFIHMDDENQAKRAIRELDGYELHGLRLRVQESNTRGRQQAEESRIPVRGNTFKIFVGNLSDRTTGQDIRELFEKHGTVVEADVVQEKKRNYGFVHMEKEEEGLAAIEALNGHTLLGVPMVVRKSGNQKTKIFVGNLLKDTKLEDVKSLFEVYGSVVESDILTNYAFIHMDDESQAQKAIRELDGYELNGQRLRVRESTSRVKQQAGMGRGDGRMDSRFPVRERGGRNYGGRYDPYPPPPPPTYARERMMRYRDDLDRYERHNRYYNEGMYERRYGDHPPPQPAPLMDKMYERQPPPLPPPNPDYLRYGCRSPPPSRPLSYGLKPPTFEPTQCPEVNLSGLLRFPPPPPPPMRGYGPLDRRPY